MANFTYRIHPAIGIARVGNSQAEGNDGFYLGPETQAGLPVNSHNALADQIPSDPDQTGGLPIDPSTGNTTITSSGLRDSTMDNGFKRQAARFRIYQYPEAAAPETYPNGLPAKEITIGSKIDGQTVSKIIWTVHVANKKANAFVLVEELGSQQGISSYENGMTPPIRNTGVFKNPPPPQPATTEERIALLNEPDRVKLLTIDPGPRAIAGKNAEPVAFDETTTATYYDSVSGHVEELADYPKSFPDEQGFDLYQPDGPINTLGELQTDDSGRLLVLGGYGRASGWSIPPSGSNLSISPIPLKSDVNNKQWFDDTSDGPVSAVIKFTDGSTQEVHAGAWVCTTDPSYAPQTLNIVPLFEDMFDAWVQNLALSPEIYANGRFVDTYQPTFEDQINPVFQAAALQRWNTNLNEVAIKKHELVGKITNSSVPPGLDSVTSVFNQIRQLGRGGTGGLMPLSLGDANTSYLAVRYTEYFFLTQWSQQKSVEGYGPALNDGEKLDKNVLMNCLGGRFSPGIDLTFIMRDPDLYIKDWRTSGMGPFRVKPAPLNYMNLPANGAPLLTEGYIPIHTGNSGLEPGDISKFLAIPWHTDYNSCATHLPSPNPEGNDTLYWSWPAQRPVAVYVAAQVKANGGKLTKDGDQLQQWSVRGEFTSTIKTSKTPASPGQNWGRYQTYEDSIPDSGIVNMVKNWHEIGVVIQGSSIDVADKGPFPADYYLEVQGQLRSDDTGNGVLPYPNYNDQKPVKGTPGW